MTKSSVWIICVALIVLSLASVAYRVLVPAQFDSTTWQSADEAADFLDRRAMMPAVNNMLNNGRIQSKDSATSYLGRPPRREGDGDSDWFYDLGGEQSPAGATVKSWLQLTFDPNGLLISHRITQDLTMPVQNQ